jgi:ParB family chromosome partitioning protein
VVRTATVPRETTNGNGHGPLPGLGATPARTLRDVPLDQIEIGGNVRLDVRDIEEMAASIREHGVLEPVKVVEATPDHYVLVFGQRRVLGSRMAGRLTVPAIVLSASEGELLVANMRARSIEQLVENLQKAELPALDRARAMLVVVSGGVKQADLARKLGLAPSTVANDLRLLETAPEVQAAIEAGSISPAHAKAIAALEIDLQPAFVQRVVSQGYSAHETERQAKAVADQAAQVREKRALDERRTADAIALLGKVTNRKSATVGVANYAGGFEVRKLLTADGWNAVEGWPVAKIDDAGSCGCKGVWRIDVPYGDKAKVELHPGCNSEEHRQARQVEQAAARQREAAEYAAARAAEREASAARDARETDFVRSLLTGSPDDPFARRLLLVALLNDDVDDSLIEQYLGIERSIAVELEDPVWAVVEAIPDEDLPKIIAGEVIEEFRYLRGSGVRAALEARLAAAATPPPERTVATEGRLPRGHCGACGADVALRKGGLVREHGRYDPESPGTLLETVCAGSGKAAAPA